MATLIKALENHSIEYKLSGNKLYAIDCYTIDGVWGFDWINITEWSIERLMYWLGY
jgi:hypothetical protein